MTTKVPLWGIYVPHELEGRQGWWIDGPFLTREAAKIALPFAKKKWHDSGNETGGTRVRQLEIAVEVGWNGYRMDVKSAYTIVPKEAR